MRVIVDFERCEGHGMCTVAAPEAFSLDDDGVLAYHFNDGDVPEGSVADVQSAVDACPVAALRQVPSP